MKLEENGSQRSRMETLDLETALELTRWAMSRLWENCMAVCPAFAGPVPALAPLAESTEDASSEVSYE